uniref:Uncharacterized protein n=2 Tax=Alexandrium monilatum TaxID=311494 RepID=A0A7S4QJA9_9DINO
MASKLRPNMRPAVRVNTLTGSFECKRKLDGCCTVIGLGAGELFDHGEFMRVSFGCNDSMDLLFRGEYDTGFFIAELAGQIHAVEDGGAGQYQAILAPRGSRGPVAEKDCSCVLLSLSASGEEVTPWADPVTHLIPVTWTLRRVGEAA